MATVAPKTDRRKIISTETVNESVLVFHRTDTGAEIARIDVNTLTPAMRLAALIYGVKQKCTDVVSAETDEAKINGLAAAVASLGAGTWPGKTSAPGSLEPAIAMLMAAQKCDRKQARQLLGLMPE